MTILNLFSFLYINVVFPDEFTEIIFKFIDVFIQSFGFGILDGVKILIFTW